MELEKTHVAEIFHSNLKYLVGNRTRASVAKECGIQQPMFNNYMVRPTIPGLINILRICDTFNVSSDWLLGRTKNDNDYRELSIRPLVVGNRLSSNDDFIVLPDINFPFSFIPQNLEHDGIVISSLVAYCCRDHNNMPAIQPGDWIIFNTNYDVIIDNNLYLVKAGSCLAIRRLNWIDKNHILVRYGNQETSKKESYPVKPKDIKIFGEAYKLYRENI